VGPTRQPLTRFLESEGLRPTIEAGLRKLASEIGRGEDEFAAAGFSALEHWTVRPTRAVTRFGSISPNTKTLWLTSLDCSPRARRDTILHEVAHVLTGALIAKRENHGPRWRRIALALGADPRRAGSDPRFRAASQALRATRLKVVARCNRCGFEIRRMRRSQRNWRRFLHLKCGGRFGPVGPQAS
jgi:predicted SprT family Zn-dependent metalloprotease